jgi:hypothetical protein
MKKYTPSPLKAQFKLGLIIGAIGIFMVSECSAQEKLHIGAGATFNTVHSLKFDAGKSIGYYVGVGFTKSVTDYFSMGGDAQYMDQHALVNNKDVFINCINLSVTARVLPLKKGLSILGGFNMGYITSAKQGNESINQIDKALFGGFLGLSYQIRRLEVITKLNHMLSDTFFQNTVQAGVNYRLSKL